MYEMKNLFLRYIVDLYQDVPASVYEGLASIFCIIAVFVISIKGLKKGFPVVFLALTIEYIILILSATVFFRIYNESSGHDFTPFWSYGQILNGRDDLLAESIMNVVVFVPVGLFFGCVSRSVKLWMVLLVGLGLSGAIEVLQFFLKRGFSEVDDVFHNTLGCMIGYGLYSTGRYLYESFIRRSVAI